MARARDLKVDTVLALPDNLAIIEAPRRVNDAERVDPTDRGCAGAEASHTSR